ncbi:RHS repeat-associated core domain-containing protein [uncultured Algoriphagus sp.]|uniref:leucine-rich repeat domain-containing protein n=1 Tax=uncultured Algoriphagus sp. TaxID=417365 RepID=UPI0030EC105D|tara:strand:+ start:11082 stop:19160 length:8079 start_codon:yes stop_codon:yes gene_type:complete
MESLKGCFRKAKLIGLALFALVFETGFVGKTEPLAITSPTSFQAGLASHNSVKLTWTYSGESADSFIIERKVNSGSFAQLTTVSGTSSTYTNTGLTVGSTYTYRIKTKKGTLFSPTTRELSIKIPDNKSFIPAELLITPGGISSYLPIEHVLPWNSFSTGNTFDVFQTPPCLTGQYYVGFELSYDLGDFNTEEDWKADLQLSFLDNGVTKWTKPLSISSLSGTWTGVVFHDVALSCGGDYKFKIQSKSGTGIVPNAQIRLTEKLYKKVGNTFNPAQLPVLTVGYASNISTLSWTVPNADFREYDLEWVFISSYDNYSGNTAAAAFAHREGVGVRLTSNSYSHPIFYPTGKLYYRVRSVGYHPDYPDKKILGEWYYGPNSGLAISNQQTAYNWQIRTDYIEGGRYKKTVNYLDGTLRSRQQISTLSGGDNTLVSETWYDFEGREAVQFLPSPDPSTSLKFRTKYNRFNTSITQILPHISTDQTKKKYHYDNGVITNNGISGSYGTGKYYNSTNAMPMINKAYLPQAQGYGAVFTEYTTDGTGRVKKQNQPGSKFRIDGDFTTRKFYGQAFPEELIRLFGTNVGDAVHYRKEVIVDPNNQASIQYINQEGQVVATALAGDSPPNLVTPLAEYSSRQTAGWGSVVYDLISHNKTNGGSKLVDASFVNTTANTPYTFAYSLSGIGSDLDQVGCQECEFTLSMSLVDPDGLMVSLPTIAGDEEPLAEIFKKSFTASDCQVNTDFSTVTISVSLPKMGEYRIIKELKVKEKSYEEIISKIRSSSTFQQEKQAVENAAGQGLGDCEICDESSPEAVDAIIGAIDGVVEAEIEGAFAEIRSDVMEQLSPEDAADPAAVEAAIQNHPNYCKYELMKSNRGSRKFELELVQISTMSQAIAGGYIPLLNKDPFYGTGGIGASYADDFFSKLFNITLGNGLNGPLSAVIDPENVSMRVNASGVKDVNGKHILYYNLLSKGLNSQELQSALDSAKWQVYYSLYNQASNELKLTIPQIYSCPAFEAQFSVGKELPKTLNELEQWVNQTEIMAPVSEQELDQALAMVQLECQGDYTEAQLTTIRNSLENYYNQNREGNYFNLILTEDLNDPLLGPIASILQSKGCSLSAISVDNPLSCLTQEDIMLPFSPSQPGDVCYSPPGIYRITEFSSSAESNKELVEKNTQIIQEKKILDSLLWLKMEDELERIMPDIPQSKAQSSHSLKSISNSSAQSNLPSAAEYQALMDFYQATNGSNWVNNSGWSTANPAVIEDVSNWHGVYTDDNGHVIWLILWQNNLNGYLPESFGNLTYLEHLQLVRNPSLGNLPQSLGNLNRIVELILYSNHLTGSIPSSIENMTALKSVHLYVNDLTGSIPPGISNLENLEFFSAYDNQLTGQLPVNIGNASKLFGLYLNGNQLSGSLPASITNLKRLEELRIYSNQFSGPLPNNFSDLTELKSLFLNQNQFTGPLPSSLGNLNKLERIWIQDNQFSGIIPYSIGQLLSLDTFFAYRNNFGGEIPTSITSLTNLYNLELGENELSGYIPKNIGNLINLRSLTLNDNQIKGSIPSSICNLVNLTNLLLHGNKLYGDIPSCIFDFNISNLTLRYNNYFFENLVEAEENASNYFQYAPQNLPGEMDSLIFIAGEPIEITGDVGNYQGSPNVYRWWKNGAAVSDPTEIEPELHISCPYNQTDCSSPCEGIYYLNVTNPDFPGASLNGPGVRIDIVPGVVRTVCTSYQLDPAFNPWLNSVTYIPDWEDVVERCVAERDTLRVKIQEAAVEKLENTWLESYYRSATTTCLDDATETLNMTVTNKEYHYTLYYYDQAGSLVQTVPPKGVKPLTTSQVNQVKAGTAVNPAHELPTKYRYNSKNQLIWQSSPDGGISQFWYNAIGQLRLSQNAKQAAANAYSYSKYDRLGRVTETGELVTTESIATLKEKFSELDFPQRPAYSCQDITITGYDSPKTGLHLKFTQEHLRNRVSYTAHLEKGKADTLLTAYSYDPHGNVKSLLQQIPGLAHKITSYKYDQISGNVNYVFYQPGTAEQLIHHYTYDADNRIETVQTSTDGYIWSTDATYYYYPHGPLARVELGEHKVQGLDYYYTLQGWLKGVNMPGGGDPGGDGTGTMRTGKDAMAFALGYFSGDYSPITAGTVLTDTRDALWTRTSTLNSNTGVYNGNISWMNTELAGSQDQYDMQAMVYKYDQLHRIVQARSLREYTTSFTSRTASTAKAYDATYTYDANGNLLTLQRRNAAAALQDNLTYGYYANSNKLRQTASSQGDNYTYDQIGNLTKDVGDGITNIEWTPSGKVRKVTKSSGSPIEFRYDASGNRVEKKQGTAITRYVRDASGNVMAVYQADTLSERPIYGSYRLGNLAYASKPGYRTVGYKQYELSNHLGNVLTVVSDRIHMDSQNTWTDVISRSDYYPFGMEMAGRTESAGYRYGFNGKEQDSPGMGGGGNTYDYGFRIYNPKVAKFLSVDPLAREFPWNSTYAFAENDVIRSIDLDGLEKLIATKETAPFITNFIQILNSDDVLVREVAGPISKKELREKVHTYFVRNKIFPYSVSSRSNGATLRPKDVQKMVQDITEYDTGDKRKFHSPKINRDKKFFEDAGLNFNVIKEKIDNGIQISIVVLNRGRSEEQQELTLLHEAYQHLKKLNDSDFKTDHLENFGSEPYANGLNPYYSPETTPPNSKMGKIETRYDNAKKKIRKKDSN